MGKAFDIRRDMAKARPCRLCNQAVFLVRVNYRVVPPFEDDIGRQLDLMTMPTLNAVVLDTQPDDDGFFVINVDPNAIAGEGFVAYDPEMSIEADAWGYSRYRAHNCPKAHDKTERAYGNRTFIDGRIVRPERADSATVGSGA